MQHLALGTGTSLLPLIKPNSLIEYSLKSRVAPGAIALYSQNKRTLCHLVLFKKYEEGMSWYFIKGNSVLGVDGWIPEYRIIGEICTVDGESVKSRRLRIKYILFYTRELIRYAAYLACFANPLSKQLSETLSGVGVKSGYFSKSFAALTGEPGE